MKGGRYSVDVEFTAQVEPGRTMGRNVSKLESYLPKGATMRLVKADPDKGVIEVEVCLSAASPAMALRDVSRAVELVADSRRRPRRRPDRRPAPGQGDPHRR